MTQLRNGGRNSRVTVEELLEEMHVTVDGLGTDGASRADLKLLSRSLRELRHAFRFFDGLRALPKVTVFGSARLQEGSTSYRQAESFGWAMAMAGWFVVTGAGEVTCPPQISPCVSWYENLPNVFIGFWMGNRTDCKPRANKGLSRGIL